MLDSLLAALILSSCVLAAQSFVSSAWTHYQQTHQTFDRHMSDINFARFRSNCAEIVALTNSYVSECRGEKESTVVVVNRD